MRGRVVGGGVGMLVGVWMGVGMEGFEGRVWWEEMLGRLWAVEVGLWTSIECRIRLV